MDSVDPVKNNLTVLRLTRKKPLKRFGMMALATMERKERKSRDSVESFVNPGNR